MLRQRHVRRDPSDVDGFPPPPVNRVLAARLATDADDTGIVMVLLDSFGSKYRRGPVHGCKPQVVPHGTGGAEDPIYAQRGDRCWVVLDEQETWVMVTWEASNA